jgi:hypothetical protein
MRLPLFYSPLPDDEALGSGQPVGLLGGASCVSPTPLILAVLNNVASSRVRLCLIAPCWPNRPARCNHPRRLSEWDRLLWHPIGKVFHQAPTFFKLHAWRLSCISSEREAFRQMLSRKCLGLKGLSHSTPVPRLLEFPFLREEILGPGCEGLSLRDIYHPSPAGVLGFRLGRCNLIPHLEHDLGDSISPFLPMSDSRPAVPTQRDFPLTRRVRVV